MRNVVNAMTMSGYSWRPDRVSTLTATNTSTRLTAKQCTGVTAGPGGTDLTAAQMADEKAHSSINARSEPLRLQGCTQGKHLNNGTANAVPCDRFRVDGICDKPLQRLVDPLGNRFAKCDMGSPILGSPPSDALVQGCESDERTDAGGLDGCLGHGVQDRIPATVSAARKPLHTPL